MGIVTAGAVFNHPLAGPVRDALAVGTTDPVFFLPEVALSAELIGMIHIHFHALFGLQKIAFRFVVTAVTGQRPCLAAMIKGNLTMGDFSRLRDANRFVIMTLTAFKTLYLIFTGFGPETPPLVALRYLNKFYRQ